MATSLRRLLSGGEPYEPFRRARRRIQQRVWGLPEPPSAAQWRRIGPFERARLTKRAAALSGAAIVLSNTLIGAETFLLVQLAYNGGQLTFDSTVGAPNFPAVVGAVIVSLVVNVVGAMLLMLPQIMWFVRGERADLERRRSVQRIPLMQVTGTLIAWTCSALVWFAISASYHGLTWDDAIGIVTAFALAGMSSACLTYLVAERSARPLLIVALEDCPNRRVTHGVRVRMVAVWAISSAVPMIGLLILYSGRFTGILPAVAGRIDWATVVLALVGLTAGARVVALVGRALTDPLTQLRTGVQRVQDGDFATHVDVYDASEIGVLQHGFNEMVAGLDERERMRELFAKHVGDTVAELAIQNGAGLTGTNADVGVLFVDIVGSTVIAQQQAPEDTVQLLNAFFEVVANVVDEHAGFVNKFEGDAAVAVFGAPVAIDDPASAALAAARDLAADLSESLDVRWGIGVSYGTAFAGNVGAERRYEYTVIGDPVNECARLSDLAKTGRVPVLASGAALAAAVDDERGKWENIGTRLLRGRSQGTEVFVPSDLDWHRPLSVSGMVSGLLRPAKWIHMADPLRPASENQDTSDR